MIFVNNGVFFLYYKVPVTCNALRFLRESLVCVVNAISHQESLSAISMIHLILQVYHFYCCWALVESKSIMEARRCWANCLQPRWRLRANVARQGVDTREHNLLLPRCPVRLSDQHFATSPKETSFRSNNCFIYVNLIDLPRYLPNRAAILCSSESVLSLCLFFFSSFLASTRVIAQSWRQ